MQHDYVLKKLILTFDPSPGSVYGWRGLAAKYLLPRFCIRDLIWYATWPCFEKVNFDIWPLPRVCLWLEGSGGKIFATTFLHLWFNLICNLTMILKSWILTFWSQGQGIGVSWVRGWGWVGLCRQNICYHGAAFMIPLNLICKMIMFWKSWIWRFYPTP